MDFPDPNRHARQFGGIGVQLYPQHTFRPNGGKGAWQAQCLGLQIAAVFDVFEFEKRDIQEVPRSAGRVQHAEGAQAFEKALVQRLGLVQRTGAGGKVFAHQQLFFGGAWGVFDKVGYLCFDRFPLGQKRLHNHRPDDLHNLVAVGVMRAKLAALVRVQPALKQGAQNGGVNVGPVQSGRADQVVNVLPFQRQGVVTVEQPTVEPLDLLKPHGPA
ncbi:hypothetical protein GALL_400680 [mine drainage metagenome]|uniref:Uncharacterized protein n=1 Tax=mine drainage metagenome TaxID=410659 RepID=A0A1J5Q4K8_9ZZZZ